ncbi:MAG: hypothetical protein WCQ26_00725, partial [Pseudanabaena sp. ELA748]
YFFFLPCTCHLITFSASPNYVQEVLKLLPQKPDPILLASIFAKVANLGAIHPIPSFADIL